MLFLYYNVFKVHDKLCKGLAIKVGKQFDVPERRQMILELLGADFVKKYFNDQPYQPSIIVSISGGCVESNPASTELVYPVYYKIPCISLSVLIC